MRTLILGAAALLSATAAQADLRATYTNEGQDMVIEVNDDGRARLNSLKEGEYTLVTPQASYVVFTEEGQVKAASMADFRAVLDEMMAGMWKSLGIEAPDIKSEIKASAPIFEEAGAMTVQGRAGRAYRQKVTIPADPAEAEQAEAEGLPAEKAVESVIVVSDDPTLAPLGNIWLRVATLMPTMGGLFGGDQTETERQFAALLNGHGVLKLDTIELKDVTFDPVDDARFALPVKILSKDEVKAMLEKEPAAAAE